jgi:hypothetical protein
MDAVIARDDRGQALIVAVLFLAIAAATLSGLRIAQERILDDARSRRAGEAAVSAATAVIADEYAAARLLHEKDIAALVTAPSAREAARAAARDLSLANGGDGEVDQVTVVCGSRSIDVSITTHGRTHRAAFEATCSRP